jgi:hypothetical protein
VIGLPELQTMRCAQCGGGFSFSVMECLACGEECLFTWRDREGAATACLRCPGCGRNYQGTQADDECGAELGGQ